MFTIFRFLNRSVLVSRKEQLATTLSVCGHPFLFSPVIALLAGCRFLGPIEAVVGLMTVLLFCLLPASLYILRKVRAGVWSDLDVSARKDRPQLFVVGLGCLLLTVLVLMLTQQPMVYARGCLAAMLLQSRSSTTYSIRSVRWAWARRAGGAVAVVLERLISRASSY